MKRSVNLVNSSILSNIIVLERKEFIDRAFREFLGRPAEAGAFDHYLKQLDKNNNNKMQIISDILFSREGLSRRQDPDVLYEVNKYRNKKAWLRLWKQKNKTQNDRYSGLKAEEINILSQSLISHLGLAENEQSRINHDILDRVNHLYADFQRFEYQSNGTVEDLKRQQLGSDKQRFFLNLSTSNQWRSHAVGIIRVERELARYFLSFKNVDFVIWYAPSNSLRTLDKYQVQQILSDAWCEASSSFISFDPVHLPEVKLTKEDIYISVGLDWDHAPTPQVLKYLRRHGAKSVLACHDLVPMKYPEFLVRDSLQQEFSQHILEMAHGATKVFVTSQSARTDLLQFWNSAGLEKDLPDVFVNNLASYSASADLPVLNEQEEAIMRDVFRKGEYILYVSSFEPRKNYKLATDLWRELWKERKANCPQFVHVGMSGWGSNDLLGRIPRMAAYVGGKINWLQRVSDNLLAHLYANCSFTIFPSLYEGWGLAATESLAFGKVCVVANNSSLQEATQMLMPSYHPLDFPNWKREIDRLLDDTDYRMSLENNIRSKYKHKTWDDFGKIFAENIVSDGRS